MKKKQQPQQKDWEKEFERLFVIDAGGNKKYKALVPTCKEEIKSFIRQLLTQKKV